MKIETICCIVLVICLLFFIFRLVYICVHFPSGNPYEPQNVVAVLLNAVDILIYIICIVIITAVLIDILIKKLI